MFPLTKIETNMTLCTREETTMGYPYTITVESELPLFDIQRVIRLACHQIDALENLFDYDNPKSVINLYNKQQMIINYIPQIFIDVLKEALKWHRITSGVFNPFNPKLNTAINFDPRGILKSIGMKYISEVLEAFGIRNYIITVWGDTLIGSEYKGLINLTQPVSLKQDRPESMKVNFNKSRMHALGKSNIDDNNENIWGVKTQPKMPDFIEATIISEDIVEADVLSLAALCEGEKIFNYLKQYNQNKQQENINSRVEGMFITGDYEYKFTENFKTYVQK